MSKPNAKTGASIFIASTLLAVGLVGGTASALTASSVITTNAVYESLNTETWIGVWEVPILHAAAASSAIEESTATTAEQASSKRASRIDSLSKQFTESELYAIAEYRHEVDGYAIDRMDAAKPAFGSGWAWPFGIASIAGFLLAGYSVARLTLKEPELIQVFSCELDKPSVKAVEEPQLSKPTH